MKKYYYLFFMTLIALSSCQKNEIANQFRTISISSDYQSNKKATEIHNVTTFKDLVHFKSKEDFQLAYETLKEAQETEVNSFYNQFANFTDEDYEKMTEEEMNKISDLLDSKSEEYNFSENGIFSEFEKQLSFKSLRADLEVKHNEWLSVSEPDWNSNPLDHQIPVPSLQTFYNVNSEIMIGSTIYKTYNNGITLIMENADYDQLLDIRSNYNNVSKYKNIEIYGVDNSLENSEIGDNSAGKTNGSGCRMNKRTAKYWSTISNRKSRIAVGISDGGAWDVTFAKHANYKYSGGKWKLSSTHLKVQVNGAIYKYWGCKYNSSRYSVNSGTAKIKYCEDMRWSWSLMQATRKNAVYGNYKAYGKYKTYHLTW